jgi:hypothetical protein
MPLAIYGMGKVLTEQFGEEKGKKLFIEQVYEIGHTFGEGELAAFTDSARENSLSNYLEEIGGEDIVYAVAWEGGVKEHSKDEGLVEWTGCPIADGFKSLGDDAVEFGEIFCDHVDNAHMEAFNPDFMVARESSLNKDGLCRLRFKKKQ